MLHIRVDDGKAVFATHIVKADPVALKGLGGAPPAEGDGIVCYSEEGANGLADYLAGRGIPSTIEAIPQDESVKAKANGVKYASRTEAEDHLLRDVEPPDVEAQRLRKRVSELEGKLESVSALEKRLRAVEDKFKN